MLTGGFFSSSGNTGNIKELTVVKQLPRESHKICGCTKDINSTIYLFNKLTLK